MVKVALIIILVVCSAAVEAKRGDYPVNMMTRKTLGNVLSSRLLGDSPCPGGTCEKHGDCAAPCACDTENTGMCYEDKCIDDTCDDGCKPPCTCEEETTGSCYPLDV